MKGSRWWLKGLVPLSSLHFNWTSSQPPSSDDTIAIKVFLFFVEIPFTHAVSLAVFAGLRAGVRMLS